MPTDDKHQGFDAAKAALYVVDELASRNLIGCRLSGEHEWAKVEAAIEAVLLRAVESGVRDGLNMAISAVANDVAARNPEDLAGDEQRRPGLERAHWLLRGLPESQQPARADTKEGGERE